MGRWRHRIGQFVVFGWLEALSCCFAVGVFGCLALSRLVPLPLPPYDAVLVGCLVLTAVLWATGMETTREVATIGVFHLAGFALEVYKVRMGSWSYPGPGYAKLAGVPLYSGFMYAAVGSYILHAWRRFDLRLTGYRPAPVAVLAGAVYLNFFGHHWLPDLRWPLAVALLWVCRRAWVSFRVRRTWYRMPLAVSFGLIGFFLWLAENIATFLGAWRYPYQTDGWRPVHLAKFGSWSLLVVVSFVLVSAVTRRRAGASDPPVGRPRSLAADRPGDRREDCEREQPAEHRQREPHPEPRPVRPELHLVPERRRR
ncbi:DUF817 domain-containing protein [Longispora sp. K20-0274]|uniref:DUF817 domain-containing protein n=1 Tax=Longispora sp. K20-0274 TaxID=3088255 RepID=UPI00399ACA04